MGAHIMNSHIARQLLMKEVQNEFGRTYPFLKIDFSRGRGDKQVSGGGIQNNGGVTGVGHEEGVPEKARALLWDAFGVKDDMKVSELEVLLQYEFGLPAQVLRKSGNLWLETRMTQHWTLREQNDHGHDIASITDF